MGWLWKCPDPRCPATDLDPFPLPSTGDGVPMLRCGGPCAATLPETAFRLVRSPRLPRLRWSDPTVEEHEYFIGFAKGRTYDGAVPIEADEYDALRSANDRVVEFMGQQTFALVVRNYAAFNEATASARGRVSGVDGLSEHWRTVHHELQVALLDWLLSSRIFLDHARTDLTDRYGDASSQVTEFDAVRLHEQTHHFGYRLMYSLRDYCADLGMPPFSLYVSGDSAGGRAFSMTLEPGQLLSWDKWPNKIRHELARLDQPFPVEDRASEMMQCLHRVAAKMQELVAPSIVDDAASLLGAASKVTETDATPYLMEMVMVPPDETTRELTPTEIPVDLAKYVVENFGLRQ